MFICNGYERSIKEKNVIQSYPSLKVIVTNFIKKNNIKKPSFFYCNNFLLINYNTDIPLCISLNSSL